MSKFDFDLFVIGAGSGGVRLARMSASMGARVAVAEDRDLGGTCVNVGCVPKKLFVYASHVQEELEDGAGFGWSSSGELSLNWAQLVTNKNREIERLNGIYEGLLTNSGTQIISGRARLVDAHTVDVNGKNYSAERIVVATGGWPRKPSFKGAEHVLTSNEFFFLNDLPETAVMQGGGYIAVELAGILQGLGVDMTLVTRGPQILRGFDQDVVEFVTEQIQNKGVKVVLNNNIEQVDELEGGDFRVSLTSGDTLNTGKIFSAIGRIPKTNDLGLENAGVQCAASGAILVNDHYQTNIPSIYAIGDVIDRVQLTPVALAEGMYLANYFFADSVAQPVDYSNIPTAVFCQPNIGTVGLTEEEARQEFDDVDVYVSSFKPMKHTMSGRNERSMMKLVVATKSDRVVGAHMVGPEAGEIIQGIAVAIKVGATKSQFDTTIGIHPTAAEEFVTMRQARD
ncbi:glutathione-disulfide reductase [Oleiphilus sp. HI0071]|nr:MULTISPECIES: glutathione-disulfide reductase [unclassified Oleiphilus]KZY74745.1 glutathione-disulfide reductase [Oleiphilus sp. HI0065]KZY87134.1 glutathione-disulfide reductase [Oleiphilus sp. HI0071]KZY91301.1 glutathione-disulfide reductase [Oleiphilus sp. HI0073]KZZ42325.1 glutathione-disulfide reductase [Oleiphilus sp. HI0118]KZZ60227.1 glutathione-disulfide reductase [Oleiphilus sp. HI0122]KZZ64594.1 glutathione-disulfide reductase [Oleiphilus sp. HI0130]KZZ82131.1 glutathione-dis